MGGRGSGGWNKLTEEEKRRRGTLKPSRSDQAYAERATAKLITGPWLTKIPKPDYPLNKIGLAKYNEWTNELFEQNKLTSIMVTKASALALLHQKFHRLATEGKEPSASDYAKFQSGMRDLDIAANAKVTASPGEKNKFEGSGFSTSRAATFRIRSSAVPSSREL